jgi:tRNA-dihydrouridine synthase
MITVHGRTRCAFYSGRADWAAIGLVKRAVRIPVIANGDVADAASARQALSESGADGVMIGRAARGRPWLLGQVAAELAGRRAAPAPSGAVLCDLVCGHYEAMLGFYGRDLGLRVARKHLGWYLDHLEGAAGLRNRVMRSTDPAAVLGLIRHGIPECGGPVAVAA